jgi:transcriptional regulator with XRE-family HTH domain
MPYATDKLVEELREARHRQGLSQTELGRRVGLPQSHISKIEKGGSDLKLSSLIEIARALSLEVKLIPRSALPIVENIARVTTDENLDATKRALDRIQRAHQIAERLAGAPSLYPHVIELQGKLEDLRPFRFSPPSLATLLKALEPLEFVRKRTSQLGLSADQLGSLASSYVSPIQHTTKSLRELRNQLAHPLPISESRQLPAHRLDDDE